MARRSGAGGSSGGMSAGPMNTIIAGFVGLLVIVAIVILGPVLAGSIENAVPDYGTCSYVGNGTVVFTGDCGSVNATDTYRVAEYNTPVSLSAEWNPDFNSDIPNGSEMWSTNVVIGSVVILVFFIALAIFAIRVIA
jgi:hypothetical protein